MSANDPSLVSRPKIIRNTMYMCREQRPMPLQTATAWVRDLAARPGQSLDIVDYRPDIEELRAVAVLAVVGFHLFLTYVNGGFIGVDIFWFCSRHLISGIMLKEV